MRLTMARLQIIGLKRAPDGRSGLEVAVQTLHRLGCVQIDDLAEAGSASVRPLRLDKDLARRNEELSLLVARAEGMLAALDVDGQAQPEAQPDPGTDCTEAARAGLEELSPRIQELIARREALDAEKSSLPRYEATLRKLLPIVPESAHRPENVSIAVLVDRAHVAVLEMVAERALELSGGRAEVIAEDVGADTRAMLLVVPREFAPDVEDLLGREDISRLRLPADFANQPPDAALAALHRRLAAIPEESGAVHQELAALARRWGPRLQRWRACLRHRLEEFAVLPRFGETDHTFVLYGWAPARELPRVRQALLEELGEAVMLETPPLTHADRERAPVALTNVGPAKPFQTLVRLLSVPRYTGIDPTALMAIFLPVFFGMILGDVAYGALLLLGSVLLLRRFRKPGVLRDILKVLAIGSAWAILFGFLYGEAFGTLGEHIGIHPLWIDRTSAQEVSSLLLFTLGVGAVHISLGLVLGVWEAIRERSRSHLLERGGMLVGLVGLFLIVGTVVHWLPDGFMSTGIALLIVGIAVLGSSLGWLGLLMGPIEFIGVVGNILSYLRLAAIGLASVYLARVANELAGSLGNLIVGVIVAVLIHALNLVMGAFSPTIHSLRLHYVEFFRKFYEGGGRPFEPFR